jgi:hypothetical protein
MRPRHRFDRPPLQKGEVLPALQLVLEHGHELGWEAVRLSHGRAVITGARLPRDEWEEYPIVILSRMNGSRLSE